MRNEGACRSGSLSSRKKKGGPAASLRAACPAVLTKHPGAPHPPSSAPARKGSWLAAGVRRSPARQSAGAPGRRWTRARADPRRLVAKLLAAAARGQEDSERGNLRGGAAAAAAVAAVATPPPRGLARHQLACAPLPHVSRAPCGTVCSKRGATRHSAARAVERPR